MTPRELRDALEAHARRLTRAADERAWGLAHLLVGMGAAPRGMTVGRLIGLLLGRDAEPVEAPDQSLTPDQSVAWMRAFMAERQAWAERDAE